jgi:hypothetical protein
MSNLNTLETTLVPFLFPFCFLGSQRFAEIPIDLQRSLENPKDCQRYYQRFPETHRDPYGKARKEQTKLYIYICGCIYSYIILYIICSLGGVNFFDFFWTHPLLDSPGGFWVVPVGVFLCRAVPDHAGPCRIVPDCAGPVKLFLS